MNSQTHETVISLGDEPKDVLGFKTEEELEAALFPLMLEIFPTENMVA
tara:strand:+ start:14802 stop:14945 length:144 start_codon:yes stop_codon:yes gene_type:complete